MAPSGRAENKDLGLLHPPRELQSSGAIPAAAAAGGGTAAEEKALLFTAQGRGKGMDGENTRGGTAKVRMEGQEEEEEGV